MTTTPSRASPTILTAAPGDAPAIAALYEPIVRDTAISFETVPPSAAEMAGRIATTLEQYPWLVARAGEAFAGYAYAAQHRQRAAYRWSVDVTVYVAPGMQRRGIGRALYTALIEILRDQGYRSAFAGIALPNPASVALHEAMGFAPVGLYRDVGFKLGGWRDVGWWRCGLSEGEAAPTEPIPFAQLSHPSAG